MNLTIGNTQRIISDWPDTDLRQLAYALATVHHETAGTMLPIRERGGNAYFHKMYDPESPDPKRAALAKKMGALPGDGVIFHGRGYVQLTWRANYLKWQKRLGVDLTSSIAAADKVMGPDIAARIMFDGMALGLFTGKKLSDYFNENACDWYNARRIINGIDCAQKIADRAQQYYKELLTV